MDRYHIRLGELPFNPAPSHFLHIDINSCFATIEQQANPFLRGRPVAVASYRASYGCVLAASREAKLFGIKTGTRIWEAKKLCSDIVVVEPDAPKYRFVHSQLQKLLSGYSSYVISKSIDEFVVDLTDSPVFPQVSAFDIASDIKQRIKAEIGEWITVSIGVGPSRFLAKTGAGIKKPDGLDEINCTNYESIYKSLAVGKLCGIGVRTEPKLKKMGLNTVWDIYTTPLWKLTMIFESVWGYYWYRKLRGWDTHDLAPSERKSVGNSFVMPKTYTNPFGVLPVLSKLVDKMSHRLRKAGYATRGIAVGVRFDNFNHWYQSRTFDSTFFATSDIYKAAYSLFMQVPRQHAIRKIAVTCFDLVPLDALQLQLFDNTSRKRAVARAMDTIKKRWGTYAITSARMIATEKYVPDRIAFGNSREIEELSDLVKL